MSLHAHSAFVSMVVGITHQAQPLLLLRASSLFGLCCNPLPRKGVASLFVVIAAARFELGRAWRRKMCGEHVCIMTNAGSAG